MSRKTKQNDITSPELISKINKNNIRLVNEYLLYLKSVQRAETTIESYRNDLDIFFVWILQNADNKDFVRVTKRDIIAFQNYLIQDNGNSPARVRRIKSTLSSLSNYIENILDDDPEFAGFKNIIKKIENPVNEPTREKTIFTEDEIQKLIDALVEKGQYQKACAVALGVASGRRKSELTRFKLSYFDDEHMVYGGSLWKTPEKIKTKGKGKGKFVNAYTIVKSFKPYLDLWIQEREKLGIDSEWLFVKKTANGYEPVSVATMNSWADTFTKIIGKDFYWHSLRHYWTSYLKKSNIPDNVIKTLQAWQSLEMVSIYNDVSDDEELSKYFGDGGIKQVDQKGITDL